MTFGPLFLTAQVVQSCYRIVLTLWLFYYLLKRIYGREAPRNGRPIIGGRSNRWLVEG